MKILLLAGTKKLCSSTLPQLPRAVRVAPRTSGTREVTPNRPFARSDSTAFASSGNRAKRFESLHYSEYLLEVCTEYIRRDRWGREKGASFIAEDQNSQRVW